MRAGARLAGRCLSRPATRRDAAPPRFSRRDEATALVAEAKGNPTRLQALAGTPVLKSGGGPVGVHKTTCSSSSGSASIITA